MLCLNSRRVRSKSLNPEALFRLGLYRGFAFFNVDGARILEMIKRIFLILRASIEILEKVIQTLNTISSYEIDAV